ncbi:MAG: heavy metal-associated domain-containing protein [Nannocystaceae bacterium]
MSLALRLVPAALLVLALGCAKEKTPDEAAPTAAKAAVAKTAPAPTKAEPTTIAAKADEGMSDCSGMAKAEASESECSKSELGCNKWDAEAEAVLKNKVPSDAKWQTYKVSGMTCGGCERKVIANLGKIDGVVGVEADAELGQVRVAISPKAPKALTAARDKLNTLYKIEDSKI